MKITILTAEESLEYWNKEKAERKEWTIEQRVNDAKMMMSLPDFGNTKWITSEHYEAFYKWIETDEGVEQWNELPMVQHLAKYYAENKIHTNGTNND